MLARKSDNFTHKKEKRNPTFKNRSFHLILGSALLLGGAYYCLNRSGEHEAPKLNSPAKVSNVHRQDNIEHLIDGYKSANYADGIAIISKIPPHVTIFKSGSTVQGISFNGTNELNNPRIKAFEEILIITADDFIAYIKNGKSHQITIDGIGNFGTKLDSAYMNGSIYVIASRRPEITKIEIGKSGSYGQPIDDIIKSDGLTGFENPSIAAAGNRIFLISDGMTKLFGFDFSKRSVKFETLNKIMGIERVKNMRLFDDKGSLYLIDDSKKILYKIDPQNMKLIDKIEL